MIHRRILFVIVWFDMWFGAYLHALHHGIDGIERFNYAAALFLLACVNPQVWSQEWLFCFKGSSYCLHFNFSSFSEKSILTRFIYVASYTRYSLYVEKNRPPTKHYASAYTWCRIYSGYYSNNISIAHSWIKKYLEVYKMAPALRNILSVNERPRRKNAVLEHCGCISQCWRCKNI